MPSTQDQLSRSVQGLMDALVECEANPAVRGIIVSSGVKRDVFTAGNSLKELHAPSTTQEKYLHFWHLSQVSMLFFVQQVMYQGCFTNTVSPLFSILNMRVCIE